ncbi:MAG: ABC transporter permease [Nakamurella sp.]
MSETAHDNSTAGQHSSADVPDGTATAMDGAVERDSRAPDGAAPFGEYVRNWALRVRRGESGMLPVLVGLVIIVIFFQIKSPVFLSAGNLANLLTQGSALILLAMAEVFVLLIGEIDLSIGFVGALSAVATVSLSSTTFGPSWPWWIALIAGLAVGAVICALQGLLITMLGLPSFVVTLAGLLGWQGVLIYSINEIGGPAAGGTLTISNNVISGMVNSNMSPVLGWTVTIVALVLYAIVVLRRSASQHARNLVTEPFALTVIKFVAVAVAAVAAVLICNVNRGRGTAELRGVPWVVPIIVAVLVLWTFLLNRTRFGKYLYAIGGNSEAARRAGISLFRIRMAAFTLGGVTAALAGIVFASRLGSSSSNIDGGQLVLYAVAAAVIGGTSLFGGRGKMIHALVGGLIVAVINSGMGLIGLQASTQLIVTAIVLIAAVVVDAVSGRSRRQTTH